MAHLVEVVGMEQVQSDCQHLHLIYMDKNKPHQQRVNLVWAPLMGQFNLGYLGQPLGIPLNTKINMVNRPTAAAQLREEVVCESGYLTIYRFFFQYEIDLRCDF